MTAASIVVGKGAAYLLTDTAAYTANGTIIQFGRKVVADERLLIALSASGVVTSDADQIITSHLAKQATTEAAVASLGELVAALADDAATTRQAGDAVDGLPPWVRLHGIAYSHHRGPAGFVCASHDAAFRDCSAMSVRGVREAISPPIGKPLPLAFESEPDRHGADLLSEQRRHGSAAGFVGGAGELTVVSAEGVTTRELIRWPDRVGERIDPLRLAA